MISYDFKDLFFSYIIVKVEYKIHKTYKTGVN